MPARQASEQYFTASQFFAQALRQLMGLPQATQGLLGRWALLPLKSFFTGRFYRILQFPFLPRVGLNAQWH